MGDGVTPAQRVTVTRLLVYTPHEGADQLARYVAARAHVAALVELLPPPERAAEET